MHYVRACTHAGGDSIERAMEGALAAMFNTITDIAKVDIDPSLTKSLDIEGGNHILKRTFRLRRCIFIFLLASSRSSFLFLFRLA